MTVNDWLAIAWVATIAAMPWILGGVVKAWDLLSPGAAPRSMRERAALPDWPPPPKCAPPPSYRDPAPRTLDDEVATLKYRVDALEAERAARTMREAMAGDVVAYEDPSAAKVARAAQYGTDGELEILLKQHEYARRAAAAKRAADADVDEFERATSEGAKR